MSPSEDHRFYADEFEEFMERRSGPKGYWKDPENHVKKNEPERLRRMADLNPVLDSIPDARILEVGSSSGFMLFPLKESGYDVVAIEPSRQFCDFTRSKGVDCYQTVEELRDAGADESGFDIIIHYGVLEHIADPYPFLMWQWEMLRPGGKIIVECPNVDDALLTLYKIPAIQTFYWVLAHCWYYSGKSFKFMLDKLGYPYEIHLDQRYDLSNHLSWGQSAKSGGMGTFTEVLGTEIEEQYKQALIRAGHSDTLVGIISKN